MDLQCVDSECNTRFAWFSLFKKTWQIIYDFIFLIFWSDCHYVKVLTHNRMDPKCQILSHILKNHLHGIFSTLVHFEFCLSLMSKWPYRWPFLMTPDDHISLTTNLHWVHNYKSSNQIATNNSDKSIYPPFVLTHQELNSDDPHFLKSQLRTKIEGNISVWI